MSVPIPSFPRPGYQYDATNEAQFRSLVEASIAALDSAIAGGIDFSGDVNAVNVTVTGALVASGTVDFTGATITLPGYYTAAQVDALLTGYSPTGHTHDDRYYTETEADALLAVKQPLDADLTAIAALAGTSGFLTKTAADTWALDTTSYSPVGHAHDDRYYTEAEAAALFAAISHTHTASQITDFGAGVTASLDAARTIAWTWDFAGLTILSNAVATQAWVNSQGYITSLAGYATETWVNVNFAPLSHTHSYTDISDLSTGSPTLNGSWFFTRSDGTPALYLQNQSTAQYSGNIVRFMADSVGTGEFIKQFDIRTQKDTLGAAGHQDLYARIYAQDGKWMGLFIADSSSQSFDFFFNDDGTGTGATDAANWTLKVRGNEVLTTAYFSNITFASGSITVGDAAGVTQGLVFVRGHTPSLRFYEADAPTDEKYYQFYASSGDFNFATYTDSLVFGETIFRFSRTGTDISYFNLYTGDVRLYSDTGEANYLRFYSGVATSGTTYLEFRRSEDSALAWRIVQAAGDFYLAYFNWLGSEQGIWIFGDSSTGDLTLGAGTGDLLLDGGGYVEVVDSQIYQNGFPFSTDSSSLVFIDWGLGNIQGVKCTYAGNTTIYVDTGTVMRIGTYSLWIYNGSGATRTYTINGADWGDTSFSIQNNRLTVLHLQKGLYSDGTTEKVIAFTNPADVL